MNVSSVPFVGAILGKIYLAVNFVNGLVRQYWLQEPATWLPNTVYQPGAMAQPSTPDGFYYVASTVAPAQVWTASTLYAVGDKVQPVTANGYYYVVTSVSGNATSGTTEPVWPATEGGLVFEGSVESNTPSDTSGTTTSTVNAIDPAIQRRYDLLNGDGDSTT